MLSDRKTLLRLAELLALMGVAVMLVQAGRTFLSPPPDYPAFMAATLCMGGLLLTFFPACLLGAEYVRTVRKATTSEEMSDGLSGTEIAFVTRWAPRPYKAAAWLALGLLLGTLFSFGGVTVTTGEKTDPSDVPAIFLYSAVFYLVCLPVSGSATRMPGTYAANAEAAG